MSARASQLVCAGCGAVVPDDEPLRFRCANAGDGGDHVLRRVLAPAGLAFPEDGERQPFVRYRRFLHAYHTALMRGLTDGEFRVRVRALDQAVSTVDGRGFRETPYLDGAALAGEIGVQHLWIKDETGNVAGSHKARHLFGIALYLDVLEATGLRVDAPLAIASCGNAALGAAVVARATGRRLRVFVPPAADPAVVARLRELGADLFTCPRVPGALPGDPCVHAFRAAVAAGAVPFTVQGSENGLTIEGGATLGLELVRQHRAAAAAPLERLIVQVGGGALASACFQALAESRACGALSGLPRIHAVQTRGGHPLERAWRRVVTGILARLQGRGVATPPEAAGAAENARFLADHAGAAEIDAELARAQAERSRYMWPWETEPRSIATGILDDVTYDWLAVVAGMIRTGGWPVVVGEETLARARDLAVARTGVDVDCTGAAGLAGLLELKAAGAVKPSESVAVLFTGIRRS